MANASSLEYYMLSLINAERAKVGADPLRLEQNLNDSAEAHSEWMLAVDRFSHTGQDGSSSNDRMVAAGFDFSGSWRSGENIGFQSERGAAGLEDDVRDIHTSLMNSSGHRANILNPNYDYIGLGIERGDYRGFDAVMITQNFATTSGDVDLDTGQGGGSTPPPPPPTAPDAPTQGPVALQGNSSANRLEGTGYNDTLYGGGGNDTLGGLSGNDVIRGNYGNDRMDGNAGADTMQGGVGDDTIYGNGGSDRLYGDPGDDVMFGGGGGDTLVGSAGTDVIRGGGGNDSLNGGDHADTLYGEEGSDTLSAGNGNDLVVDARGNNELRGGSGRDTLNAGSGNDRLYGDGGADMMHGGAGDDTLRGGGSADTIDGGPGDDLLYGNWGKDIFVFVPGSGDDTIGDFEDDRDVIDLTANNFNSLSEIMNRADNVGRDVVIDLGGGDSLRIEDTSRAEIADDLLF
ncbi:CAP domain-containing protein [Sulfitobacter sp. S190]|uniref:CAP domain-containing protein n=1 Tax=Sulfitobacter sp. S190 TaxID=2867022 RepID=UPI0021A8B647|nr:CAP domain-containing protein [Sulfitobacter sp. S190]UWR24437.1 hypothetical protein K3756_18220 [Sulfitobacter sp. S190]